MPPLVARSPPLHLLESTELRSRSITRHIPSVGIGFVPDGEEIYKKILDVVRSWLAEIENSRYSGDLRQLRSPFNGELSIDQLRSLEGILRHCFLTSCDSNPALAFDYVKSLLARGREAQDVKLSVIRFPGLLPLAEPTDLAQIAIETLIQDDNIASDHWLPRPPFLSVLHQYSPPSAYHGPFINLLTHAPKIGVRLVRRVVD